MAIGVMANGEAYLGHRVNHGCLTGRQPGLWHAINYFFLYIIQY